MSDTGSLHRVDMVGTSSTGLQPGNAVALDLKEKDFEKWVVDRLETPFTDPEAVRVFLKLMDITEDRVCNAG